MTKNKRFTITQDFEEHHRQIRDNGHIIMGCFIQPQAEVIVDVLNNLNDENEELKQFKEDVFTKIDMHLRMLPTARDNEFNEKDGDPSLYSGAIYMLETLKKELQEYD